MRLYRRPTHRGQTLVELALVLPLFLMVLVGIIGLGIGVFYQQQISNAAREAARYASIHSASSLFPTAGTYDPDLTIRLDTYPVPGGADRKVDGWPYMTAHARDAVFGLPRSDLKISACWSGYQSANGTRDAAPPGTYDVIGTITSTFVQCSIDGVDPTVDLTAVGCRGGMPTTDQASSQSESSANPMANTVTAYACYAWSPPMAGFLLIPSQVMLRALATEPIERQQ